MRRRSPSQRGCLPSRADHKGAGMQIYATIIGSGMLLSGDVVTEIRDVLSYTHTWQERDGYRKVWRKERRELFTTTPNGSILTFVGLYEAVNRFCRQRRIRLTVRDQRPPLPDVDFSILRPLRIYQDEAIALLCSYHDGIIKLPTGAGKTFIIEEFCRLNPDLHILVTTGSLSVLGDLYDRISAAVVDDDIVVGITCSKKNTTTDHKRKKKDRRDPSVAVVSSRSLHKVGTDWPDVLIFDEVHESSTASVLPHLARFGCRKYGFSATPKGRAGGTDKETVANFGPIRINKEYVEGVTAGMVVPIRAGMLTVRLDHEVTATTDRKKEQLGYWQNSVRNNLAVDTAEEVFSASEQVLFMTKTVEHALVLQQLTGFPIARGGIEKPRWLQLFRMGLVPFYTEEEYEAVKKWATDKKVPGTHNIHVKEAFLSGLVPCQAYVEQSKCDTEILKTAFRENRIQRLISTLTFKQGVDFPHLQGLFRMDGMTSGIPSIQMGGRLSRTADDKWEGRLYDFYDDFGPWFLRRSEIRIENYRKEGWNVEYL